MRKLTSAALLLAVNVLLYFECDGQQKDITLTWNPFSFVEEDAGFTPGIDIRLGKRTSLLSDVGVIFYNAIEPIDNTTGAQNGQFGFKLKPELRLYLKENSVAKGFFASVELLYKHVNYKRFDGVTVLDNLGNIAYTDFRGHTIKKDVFGASIKIGWRIYFSKQYRLGMDIYGGLGARHKNFAIRNLPPCGSFDRSFFSENIFDPYWQEGGNLSMPAGIKLIWRLQ